MTAFRTGSTDRRYVWKPDGGVRIKTGFLLGMRMESTKACKVSWLKVAGWVFFTAVLVFAWCWALLWCVLCALSHMMR